LKKTKRKRERYQVRRTVLSLKRMVKEKRGGGREGIRREGVRIGVFLPSIPGKE
jgi:hypothetical protein